MEKLILRKFTFFSLVDFIIYIRIVKRNETHKRKKRSVAWMHSCQYTKRYEIHLSKASPTAKAVAVIFLKELREADFLSIYKT